MNKQLQDVILQNVPDARLVSGGTEIVMRCRFCGDSSNPNSAHFYVSVGDENAPPLYNCKKCNEGGILTPEILRNVIGIYDSGTLMSLYDSIKNITSKPGGAIYSKELTKYRLYNTFIRDDEGSRIKLNYINNRLGLNLSYDDILKKKIVLNLYDLLRSNGIKTLTRTRYISDQLDKYFIGFLSIDNSFINMRNLNEGNVYKSIDRRYVNYNIFNKKTNLERYYVIPCQIYAGSIDPIKINLAEGVFDILSVFYNVRNMDTQNSIYCAVGGKGYLNALRYFTTISGLINIEIHLYLDNDYEDRELNRLLWHIRFLEVPIYIHRNIFNGEKDFGVSKDHINESISRVI